MKGCLVSVRRASHSLEKQKFKYQITYPLLLCLLSCSTKEKLLSANKAEPEFLHLCMPFLVKVVSQEARTTVILGRRE
jgi:hypothetical protein